VENRSDGLSLRKIVTTKEIPKRELRGITNRPITHSPTHTHVTTKEIPKRELRDVNPVWCSPLLQPVVTKKFMKGVRVNYNRSGILVWGKSYYKLI
jgi:hypothetical protein